MAEIAVVAAQQIDWITIDDQRASLRRLLQASAERVGIPELSHWLNEDPSTIRNQLAYREKKRPSSDLEHLCWLLDPEYRRLKCGVTGEVLSRPPDLDPADVVREVAVLAGAGVFGNDAKERVLSLIARMRKAA